MTYERLEDNFCGDGPGCWHGSPEPLRCPCLAAYTQHVSGACADCDAGLSRESLYKALSGERNPSFGTILKVIGALGLKLHAEPALKS